MSQDAGNASCRCAMTCASEFVLHFEAQYKCPAIIIIINSCSKIFTQRRRIEFDYSGRTMYIYILLCAISSDTGRTMLMVLICYLLVVYPLSNHINNQMLVRDSYHCLNRVIYNVSHDLIDVELNPILCS